jgi:hypothetical protein
MNKKLLLILIIFLSSIVSIGYCGDRIPGLQVIDTVDEDSDSIIIFDASTNKTKRIHPSAIAPGATYNYTETATTVTNANVVNEATTVTNSDLTIESGATYSYTENATTVTNADLVNTATNVTTATDISGTATNVTTATDISGTATNVTTATDISGTATNTTTATDISGTSTNVTTATDISGTATNVTTATDISGTATNVTTATDISGTATDISGTATNVTTATDISGTATNVTTATDISGTATTVTASTDISGTATTVTSADGISGTATNVTTATDISGTATGVTTAADISGTATTVTTATDISGTATNVTTATDISGTATNVTTATDISGTATTVTSATDISGQAYNSTFNGSVGTVNEVTDELSDDDGDTKIQVEEGADDDTFRLDIGGTENRVVIGSNSVNFSTDGGTIIEDIGSGSAEYPLNIKAPNLTGDGGAYLLMTRNSASGDQARIRLRYYSTGYASNYLGFGFQGNEDILRVVYHGGVGIGATPSPGGAKLYVSGTGIYTDTLTLSKGSGDGLVVTADVDLNGNEDLAGTLDIGSSTTRRVAPAGTFVNNSNGNCNISDTQFRLDTNLADATWESVGPFGSGADNIWTALNDVPTDADWVELKVYLTGVDGGASATVNSILCARANGSSEAYGSDNAIGLIGDETDGSGNAHAFSVSSHKVPVSSAIFDLYFDQGFTANVSYVYLTGWGFNP